MSEQEIQQYLVKNITQKFQLTRPLSINKNLYDGIVDSLGLFIILQIINSFTYNQAINTNTLLSQECLTIKGLAKIIHTHQ